MVRHLCGPYAIYHIWIPNYGLLKKGWKFEWGEGHSEAMQRLKGMLTEASGLRKEIYGKESPIYVVVDTNLTRIRWVIIRRTKPKGDLPSDSV